MKLKWLSYSNEYRMKLEVVLKFNRVKNEAISDFLGQMSQDWSLKWSTFTNEYRMKLERALKL